MITIMIGISGSGKSTYANKLRQRICSTDRFIDTYAEKLGVRYDEAFDQIQLLGVFGDLNNRFYSEINQAISQGEDFIIDRTNLTVRSREQLLIKIREFADSVGVKVIIKGIVFDLNKVEILKRLTQREKMEGKKIPQDVIDKQFKMYESPTIEEGFDVLEQKHE
jgi:predicted kinase|tara:strand:+ start:7927 stop:8421 length:495 start_codon:yes stop_codon:yes gene_type:complete